jgi:tocopherol O-methyltransferase
LIASAKPISAADVARHYDELDYFYRDVWGDHVHHGLWRTGREDRKTAVRQLAHVVAQEAGVGPGLRICDIGCGYGATARLLAQEYGAEVTAITISPAQHAFASAQSPGARNPDYLLGDWLQSTLPPSSFDAAVAIESSEHMPDKARFFTEAARVLHPGGRLVVCAWMSCHRPTARQQALLLEPICREGRMPHMADELEYRRLAEAAGFRIERFQDVTRQVESTWPRIAHTFLVKLLGNPRYLKFLFNRHASNRVFALTIFRLWLAYRTGAMRYGILTAVRP